jgi:GNAT superfamily N-acetyltransferase
VRERLDIYSYQEYILLLIGVFRTNEEGIVGRLAESGDVATVTDVRPARADELDAIAGLFAPGLARYRGRGADWILDAYLAELLDVRSRFGVAETYVAVVDGRILGSIAFYRDVVLEGWSNLPAGWAGFRALVVHPDARGSGTGRQLVEHCLLRARAVGAPALGIHTIALLEDAVRLYERVGFVRCPEFDMPAADVFPSHDADDGLAGLAFRHDL